jgi:hypothetical protein
MYLRMRIDDAVDDHLAAWPPDEGDELVALARGHVGFAAARMSCCESSRRFITSCSVSAERAAAGDKRTHAASATPAARRTARWRNRGEATGWIMIEALHVADRCGDPDVCKG